MKSSSDHFPPFASYQSLSGQCRLSSPVSRSSAAFPNRPLVLRAAILLLIVTDAA